MAKLLRLRRGTTTQHGSFTGAEGEVTVDTDKTTLVVHPGGTQGGGEAMLREDLNNMPASGVTAGTYGSASAIPAITVDAKGRVTSATTNAIDSTSIANGTSNVSVTSNSNVTVVNGGTTVGVFQSDGPQFNDNIKAKFGTGSDLQIYHDGSDSYIKDAGTGSLVLQGTNWYAQTAGGASHIEAVAGGATSLFHNGNNKLQTTSGGVNITGSLECDGLGSDGAATIRATGTPILTLQDTGSSGAAASAVIQGMDSGGTQKWQIGDANGGNENLVIANVAAANIEFASNSVTRGYFNGSGHFVPGANNTYDLGGASLQWRDGYFDGTVHCDGLTNAGQATFEGSADHQLIVKDNNNTGTAAETGIGFRDNADTTQGYLGFVENTSEVFWLVNTRNAPIVFGTNGGGRCQVNNDGHFVPNASNTYDLGLSTNRWRNVYTNDLNLSNEGGSNDVDGTWGSWTIQEGEDDLFLLNRRNGKKYKFNLSEVN